MEQIIIMLQSVLILLQLVSGNPSLPQEFRDVAISMANNAIAQGATEIRNISERATLEANGLVPDNGGTYMPERQDGRTLADQQRHDALLLKFEEVTGFQTSMCQQDRKNDRYAYFFGNWAFDPEKDPAQADRIEATTEPNRGQSAKIQNKFQDCVSKHNTKYKTPAQMEAYRELKQIEDSR